MNKKSHSVSYSGDIHPFIWMLIISIVCIAVGLLFPVLSLVGWIGGLILAIWIVIIIATLVGH